ncbi:hypothetical protein FALBO_10670 [Fusarium albosuccineum]|uniref:Uncharacterized protein n=1 Tax=Fusarium albosuccineum TaxID=1237068 RepID=A0A8H4PIC0_9HYPO|nr:hypothetical protein FALBO_10670 [Fusarium albosuccineum]
MTQTDSHLSSDPRDPHAGYKGIRDIRELQWIEYINKDGHIVAIDSFNPNEDNYGHPSSTTDSGSNNTGNAGLRIIPEIKLTRYTNRVGRVVAMDMDNCSVGGGPQMRIAAPTPLGGYFVKSDRGADMGRVTDMLMASGADSCMAAIAPVHSEIVSWRSRDPDYTRNIRYSSGRPSSSEDQSYLPPCGIQSIDATITHAIARIEPVRHADIAAARADPQIRRVIRSSPW